MLLNTLKPIHTSFFNHIIDLLYSLLLKKKKKKFCYLLGFLVYTCINYAVIALSVRLLKGLTDLNFNSPKSFVTGKGKKKKRNGNRGKKTCIENSLEMSSVNFFLLRLGYTGHILPPDLKTPHYQQTQSHLLVERSLG